MQVGAVNVANALGNGAENEAELHSCCRQPVESFLESFLVAFG